MSERLTDRRTAEQVRENIEKLRAARVEPSVSDVRYVKLAKCEEKPGKWENEQYDELLECYSATCSECGYESTDRFRITDNHRHCEYCGARMDLKEE